MNASFEYYSIKATLFKCKKPIKIAFLVKFKRNKYLDTIFQTRISKILANNLSLCYPFADKGVHHQLFLFSYGGTE